MKAQQTQRVQQLSQAIQQNPGKRPSFFARLFGWRNEEVGRTAARFDRHGILISEDDKGGLWPFKFPKR